MSGPIRDFYIDRRTVLKGLTAALGLPLLEAMTGKADAAEDRVDPLKAAGLGGGSSSSSSSSGGKAVRLLFINTPNGMWMDDFTPAAVGALTALQPTMKALEPFRGDFSVLSGLALDNARAKGDGPGDHARSSAAFLTGAHPRKTKGSDIKLGVSVDQVCATTVGQKTRLPSLELGCEEGRRAGECDSGYSCAYVSNISWANETTPMPKLTNPAQVFDRLFGDQSGADMTTRLAARKSILDFVRDDSSRLQKQLGASDQQKLDNFMTSVREIERRVEQNLKANAGVVRLPAGTMKPTGIPKDYAEHIRTLYDMIVLAFQTDVTRISSFLVANEGSNRNFGFLGVNGAHHELSHHGRNPEKVGSIKKIDRFYMDQFAYFIKKMKETKDGNATLLDNSMIVLGSGIGDGDRHNHDDLPVILAGKGGGTLIPGRHIKYGKNTPMCNLYLSLMQRMGVTAPRFGDSSGPLNQLS